MREGPYRRRGQVILMVTFALFAMAGLLGLAVDLGWSYFVKKSAQAAADSAALAAVQQAFDSERPTDGNDTFECGIEAACGGIQTCPVGLSPDNLQRGCLYAQTNDFPTGGRQTVTMEGNITSPAPTVPGVTVHYWATARAARRIPQLFSSILGNTTGVTSARATAAVVNSAVGGSLILINRDNECLPLATGGGQLICGVDLLVQANNNQGHDAVVADGGILMASSKHGVSVDGHYSGENTGGGTVRAPFTFIRGDGDVDLQGGASWIRDPVNGLADRFYFQDPMRGKGQPPPPTELEAPPRQVLLGTLIGSNDPSNPAIYPPGSYYAVDRNGNATGDPLTVSGYVRFSNQGSGFGNFVFFGGIRNQAAGTTVTFDPGRYVFAGVKQTGQNPGALFDIQVNMILKDQTSSTSRNSDAGEIFIFTDPNYPGLYVPPEIAPNVVSQLRYGVSGFQTGNNADVYINIHGLNLDHPSLPEGLKTFAPTVIWQDQGNSIVRYTPEGNIDLSCPGATLDNPCGTSVNPASTELFFKASPNLHIYGVAYQPRGAFTSMNGGGGYDSPLQLIAGALAVHGNANVQLAELNNPLFVQIVALIE